MGNSKHTKLIYYFSFHLQGQVPLVSIAWRPIVLRNFYYGLQYCWASVFIAAPLQPIQEWS